MPENIGSVLKFQNNIPVYYQEDRLNNKKKISLPSSTTKENKISFSFATEACKNSYLQTLSKGEVMKMLMQLTNSGIINKKDFDILKPSTHLELLKSTFIAERLPNLYTKIIPVSDGIASVIRDFFKELECFTNIKFSEDNKEINKDYTIAVCATIPNFLQDNFHKSANVGFAPNLPGQMITTPYNESVIILDGSISTDSTASFNCISIIKAQVLHACGLGAPYFDSLNDQIMHRTILENINYFELPLAKFCLTKYNSPYSSYQLLECLAPPEDVTPVDVKGIQSIWGISQNEDEFCKNVREHFNNEFINHFEIFSSEHAGL